MIWLGNYKYELESGIVIKKFNSFLFKWLIDYQWYTFWLVRQLGYKKNIFRNNRLIHSRNVKMKTKNLLYFYSTKRLKRKLTRISWSKNKYISSWGFKNKYMKLYFIKLLKLNHKFDLVSQLGRILFKEINIKKGSYGKRKKKFIWFLGKQLGKVFQIKMNKFKFLKTKSHSRIKNLQQKFFKSGTFITKRIIKQLSVFGLRVNREIFSRIKYGYGQYLVIKRMDGNTTATNFLRSRFFIFFCRQVQLLRWLLNVVYLFSLYGLNESLKFLCSKLVGVKRVVGNKVERFIKIILNVCSLNFYITVIDLITGKTIIKFSAGLVGFKGRRQKRRVAVLKSLIVRLVGFLIFLVKGSSFKNIIYRFIFSLKQSLVSNKIDNFFNIFFYLLKRFNFQRKIGFENIKRSYENKKNSKFRAVKKGLKIIK
jgi:hypothetical protein